MNAFTNLLEQSVKDMSKFWVGSSWCDCLLARESLKTSLEFVQFDGVDQGMLILDIGSAIRAQKVQR